MARRRPWLEELELRLAPATVQFSTASETVNATAGTFSIPVTVSAPPTVSTFATGFNDPVGLAADSSGNLYVASYGNGTIDKVTPAGVVSGYAAIGDPEGVAVDPSGDLFIASLGTNTIEKVTPAGVVTTVIADLAAQGPVYLACDAEGNLYFTNSATTGSGAGQEEEVDKLTPAGVLSAFVNNGNYANGLAFDSSGNLYVSNFDNMGGGNDSVDKVTPAGVITTYATGFNDPAGLAFDAAGNLYVANSYPGVNTVSMVTPAGVVSTYASGLDTPTGLAFSGGNLYVSNAGSGTVSEVSGSVSVSVSVPFTLGGTAVAGTDYSGVTASPLVIASGQTSGTITGTLLSDPGPNQTLTFTLGPPTGASLGSNTVNTLTIDEPATVQFSTASETINETAGTFSIPVTLTGTPLPTAGTISTLASGFNDPMGLAADSSGNLYVASYGAGTVSKVTPAGVVSVYATIGDPEGIAFDPSGDLFIAGTNTIEKVTPAGVVTTVVADLAAQGPVYLACDAEGNLYFTNSATTGSGPGQEEEVDKLTPAGVLSAYVGTGKYANGLAFDSSGNLYVSNFDNMGGGNDSVDKVTPAGVITTYATGFNDPAGLAFDSAGNLYVANSYPGVNTVSMVTPAGVVSTYATGLDTPTGLAFSGGNLYVTNVGSGKLSEVISSGSVSVPFTLGGTAQSGTDYSGVTTSPLVFNPGQTSDTITGTLLADPGPNKTLTVTLNTPSGAILGSPSVNTLTINEPATVQFSSASETVNESAGTFSIPVTLTGTPQPTVSTFASGFSNPQGLAFDAAGNLYVANYAAGTVSKVTPAGVVSTFASGFGSPDALAFDAAGNLYVANFGFNSISEVTPAGVVSTFVSNINNPAALAFDSAGNLYVANDGDTGQPQTVSMVTPAGVVSIFASGFLYPVGLAFDSAGNLYVANETDANIEVVDKVTPAGVVSTFASGFTLPDSGGLAFDGAGNLYVASYGGNSVSEVTPAGVVSTFVSGISDPYGLAFVGGNLYVANSYGANTVSEVSDSVSVPFTLGGSAVAGTDYSGVTASPLVFETGQTSDTITGTLLADPGPSQTLTFTLGTPRGASLGSPTTNTLTINEPTTVQFSTASETINETAGTFSIPVTLTGTPQPTVSTFASGFTKPLGLAFDAAGNLYVANYGLSNGQTNPVSEVTPAGVVSTFASGFSTPFGLAFDSAGNLYVSNYGGSTTVDKVTPAGVVSTFVSGLSNPGAMAFDASGNLYVAVGPNDNVDGFVDKITPAGVVSTFASGFIDADALAFDAAGNLYVANGGAPLGQSSTVEKVTPAGVVSVFASGFDEPFGMAFDSAGNLYVANAGTGTVSEVTPAGVVSTFASGFNEPAGLAFDSAGNLYVANWGGSTVSEISSSVSVPFTLGGTAQSGTDYSGVTASPLVLTSGQTSATITGTLLSDPGANQTLTITLGTPSGAGLGNPNVNTLTIVESVTITATSGGGQSAAVNTAFASPLVATVTDGSGNPLSGVTVTFATVGSGPGVTFPDGSAAITNAQGQASIAVAANTGAGSYTVTASVSGLSTPADFTLTNDPGAPAAVTTTSGGGQSALVNTAFAASLVATVTDAYGNPITGVTVTFAGPGSGPGVIFSSGDTATTDNQGQASLNVTANTIAGSDTVTVSVSGVSTSATFGLTNTPGTPAAITAISGGLQSAVVNTAFAAPLVATVTDQFGNPVPGITVTFASSASGAGVTFPGGDTAVTNANGQASLNVAADTSAGSYTVTASVSGVSTAANFTLTNNPGAPAAITATSGGSQSTVVNTAFAALLVATVTDAYENPIPGVTVTWAAPTSGSSSSFPDGDTATTNAQGQASSNVIANTSAGSYTITASISGLGTPAGFTLTNLPGAVATITAISGGSQNALVNTAFAMPLVVSVTDQYGNPVSGVTVTVAGPASGAGVGFPGGNTAATNAQGQASLNVAANNAPGSYTTTASVSGLSTGATFALTNIGPPASVAMTSGGGQNTTVSTAFAAPLVATVLDVNGNPVPNVLVTFVSPTSGGGVTFPDGDTATTNTQGQARLNVTANSTAGSYTVTASVNGVSSAASFALTNNAGAAATITTTSGGGQSATVNTAFVSPLVATVTDADGNPVSGVAVTFAGPASGVGATFPDGDIAVTNANGQASLDVAANTGAGAYTVTASAGGVHTTASFALMNDPGLPTALAAISGNSQSALVNTAFAAPLVVKVTDAYGNAVSGVTVTFAGPGSGAGVSFLDGNTTTTNAQGQASLNVYANTSAGSYSVTASVSGISTPVDFTLLNNPGAAATITAVSGGPQSALVNSAFAAPLVVEVTDTFGNPVGGAIVTYAGPANGASVTFPEGDTATTNAQGQVSLNVNANTSAGSYTVAATVSGLSSTADFALTNNPGAAAAITATSGGSQSAVVNTVFAAPLVANVTDQFGNPLSGVTVTFAAPSSGAGVTFPDGNTAVTNAQGQASLIGTANSIAGPYTVTASVSGLSTPANYTLTNDPGAPSAISAVSGNGQRTAVNTAFASPLVATVTDANGNPIPNVTVTFAGPASGAGVAYPDGDTALTNAHGQASLSVAANASSGSYTITASAAGVSTPIRFALTNDAGAAAAISATSGGGQSATVNTAFANPLVATVTDAEGNPVPGITVTFASSGNGAGVTFPGGDTAITNASGQVSLNVAANTSAGSYTVIAFVSGITTVSSFALVNNPGAPAAITATSGGSQSAVVNTPFAAPLAVRVTDTYGNPVNDVLVTYGSPGSGAAASFLGGNTATTNAQGQASLNVTANSIAGSYTVTASLGGVSTPASFALTNTPIQLVIQPISPQTVATDGVSTLSFTITAQSNNGSPITYSLGSGAPAGASINAQGVFTWAPSEANGNPPGVYNLTVTVAETNVPATMSSATFTVTVGSSSTNQGSGATAQDNINMRTAVAAGVDNRQEYYTDLLDADYLKYVNRLPTQAELTSFWYPNLPIPGQASAGADFTDQEIEAYFIGSPEYIQDNGGTDALWIAGMYQSILGRPAQPSEINYWLNQKQADLNSGMSVGDADIAVAKGIVASNASESILVGADYTRYLGRSGSASEVAYWVNLFETGYTNEQLIAGFVGSQEFFQDHGSNIIDWLYADYQATLNRLPDQNGFTYWENQL